MLGASKKMNYVYDVFKVVKYICLFF